MNTQHPTQGGTDGNSITCRAVTCIQITVPRASDGTAAPRPVAAGADKSTTADLPVVPRPGEDTDEVKTAKTDNSTLHRSHGT